MHCFNSIELQTCPCMKWVLVRSSIRGYLEAQYLIILLSEFALDPTLLQSINVSLSASLLGSQPWLCHAGFCQERPIPPIPGCLWFSQEFWLPFLQLLWKKEKKNQQRNQNKCHFSELSSRLLWPMLQFLVLYLLCFWPLRKAILSCYKTSKVQWAVSDGHASVLTLVKLISRNWKFYCLSFFGDTKTSSVWVPGSLKRMDGFPLIFGWSKQYLYGIICIPTLQIYLKMEECKGMKCTHFQSMIWSQEHGVMKPAA